MQACAPDAVDTANESEATRKLYGLDNAITEPFGRQCLMARRLVERGVRFVQLFQGGAGNANVTATNPLQPRGTDIQGGEVHRLTKGDVIVVPAGQAHWFKEVPSAVSYYVVKVLKQ